MLIIIAHVAVIRDDDDVWYYYLKFNLKCNVIYSIIKYCIPYTYVSYILCIVPGLCGSLKIKCWFK
jgi:hypothetical protein